MSTNDNLVLQQSQSEEGVNSDSDDLRPTVSIPVSSRLKRTMNRFILVVKSLLIL
jgi:hypothetical protein